MIDWTTFRLIKQPHGFLPILLSTAALAVVVLRVTLVGAAPELHAGQPDEGAAAHLWQIFMLAQAPIVARFVMTRVRTNPRGTLAVLAVQTCAILAATAPVFLLGW